jgi:CRISPR/Cas system CMR-associated protein Cmr3 (group 5 of RAMP superfamily)
MMTHTYVADFIPAGGLVFRDARPFDAGVDTVAGNLDFPPPPEAFWSALNLTLVKTGSRSQLGAARRLRVRAFYLFADNTPLLPVMADTVIVQAEDNGVARSPELRMLRPCGELPALRAGSHDLQALWFGEQPGARLQPCEGAFLGPDAFVSYLSGRLEWVTPEALHSLDRLFTEQLRTGVQLEGRNAAEGRLYTERVILPDYRRDVRFRVLFETPEQLPQAAMDHHLVRLGGESKLAVLVIEKRSPDRLTEPLPEYARRTVWDSALQQGNWDGPFRVKLCLMAPAVYSARRDLLQQPGTVTPAWRPYWMQPARGGWCRPILDRQKYRLRLVAAAAPKAFPRGAWDRRNNLPRPLYRCQPAGTVYYFELSSEPGSKPEEALEQFFDDFWLGSLLVKAKPALRPGVSRTRDSLSSHALRGFGWTTIGVWKP